MVGGKTSYMTIKCEYTDSVCKLFNEESQTLLCEITVEDGIVKSPCTQIFNLCILFKTDNKVIGNWEFFDNFYCDPKIAEYIRLNVQVKNINTNMVYDFYGYAKCSEEHEKNKLNVLNKAVEIISLVAQCEDINDFDQLEDPVFIIK